MKPRVFIALATGILGGPGKGLVQFLQHGGLDGCYPLMVDFRLRDTRKATEYERAIRASGAPMAQLLQNRTIDPALVGQGLELVRRHNITLLQSHGYKSHVLCWRLRQKTGLPWIAFVHGWTRENIKVRLYHGIEHVMLLLADEVVAVSESLRQRLLPPVRKRCKVIPNAVSSEEMAAGDAQRKVREELGIPDDAVVVGVVGRLSPEKGQDIFLRALARARETDQRVFGLLAGNGQERERLLKLAADLGVGGHCRFTGHIQGLVPYYRGMDILALPSFSEGMPNAALEGMLMGLPVVASRVGGVPEVVRDGETGRLIPAGNVEALASAMLDFAADPGRREAFGLAGKQRALAEFHPRVRVERILRLYAALSAKGKKP